MNLFFHLIIFVIIFIVYINIIHLLKTSEDLEIYELDYKDNDYFQEVCNLKQPATFSYEQIHPNFVDSINEDFLELKSNNDVKIKEIPDYYSEDIKSVDYFILPLKSYLTLIKSDTHGNYISEDNHFFIEESGTFDLYQTNDDILQPKFSVNKKYDLLCGSKNAHTTFKYHNNLRHYLVIHSGKIKIKMTPWKSHKYLYPIKDYYNYEFRSPINIWKPQRKYFQEMDKMKFLDFELEKGQALYIPPYWWYSIQYTTDNTIVSAFTYDTLTNYIATSKDIGLYYLQQSNTKTKISKTFDLPKINESNDDAFENEQDEKQKETIQESSI
tara:strand:+ start:28322 stop:29302 length:981 start_codon:yes stop_codon:yes gene_type:complete